MIFLIDADDFILKDYQEHEIEATACNTSLVCCTITVFG